MKRFIVCLLTICIIWPQVISAHSINPEDLYFNGTFHQAVLRAQQDDKLLLLEFSADWCMPCEWMKKNTFTDSKLLEYLKDNAIVLDLNIDEFHGFELKQQFDVRFLPTIILLNSKGDILQRIEHSIGADQLKSDIEALVTQQNISLENKILPKEDIITEPILTANFIQENIQSPKSNTNVNPQNDPPSYLLQCGAFSDKINAIKLKDSVESIIEDNLVIVRLVERKYKVFISGIEDFDTAQSLQSQLKSTHKLPTLIRKE